MTVKRQQTTRIVENTKAIKDAQKQIEKQAKWLLKTSELTTQTWTLLVEFIDGFVSAEDLETKNKAEVEKSLLDLKEKMNQFFTFEGGIRRQRQTAVTTTSTIRPTTSSLKMYLDRKE